MLTETQHYNVVSQWQQDGDVEWLELVQEAAGCACSESPVRVVPGDSALRVRKHQCLWKERW